MIGSFTVITEIVPRAYTNFKDATFGGPDQSLPIRCKVSLPHRPVDKIGKDSILIETHVSLSLALLRKLTLIKLAPRTNIVVMGKFTNPKRPLRSLLGRLLRFLRRNPPPSPRDPFAWKSAPLKPRPRRPAGSVAVAEPDE